MKEERSKLPTLESSSSPPHVPVNMEENVGRSSALARKSTRIVQFVLGAEKEMMECCDDAETLIDKCRRTKDMKTCQEATREMALCMHYQQESYDW
jgi:hypothetical protein